MADAPNGLENATFLTGGGEMGALMRAHDWSMSPLGPPDAWPQALRSAVQICLNTPIVCAVHWGPDLRILYNHAYSPALAERHPWALGRPFSEVWSEIWDVLGPQIASVVETGRGFSTDHQLLKMNRNGRLEDTYWIYSFAPLQDGGGAVAGVFVTALETTDKVVAERRAAEMQEHQRQMLRQMPGFVGMLSGPDLIYTYVNDAYVTISERTEFVGRRFRDVFADIEGQGYFEAFENAYRNGKGIVMRGIELRLHGREDTQYVDFVLEPIRDDAGAVTGLFVGGYETTEIYRGNAALRQSEARLAFLDLLGAQTAAVADADAVLSTTTRLLGEYLNLSVCAYADMDEDEDGFTIRGGWAALGSTSIVGHYSLADFGKLAVKNLSAGLPLVVNDNLKELAPEEAGTFQNIGIAATICMPLVKDGRLTALMAIHDRVPRVWTGDELHLLREVTARSWAHVERVGATAELRASEGRFRAAVDAVQGVLWTNNAAGEMTGEQPGWAGLTGQSFDEYRGYGWSTAVHPDDAQSTLAAWTAAVADKCTFVFEHRVRRHDGEWRRFSVRAIPIFAAAGDIREWVGVHTDVTEQRAAESALRESEIRFRGMADHAPVMVWVTDANGYCTYLNRAWYEFTGQSEREAGGFGWLDATHPDDKAEAERTFLKANARQEAFRLEYRLRRADGTYRWAIDAASPRFGPGSEFLGYIGSVLDIDERREMEERLRGGEARLRAVFDQAAAGFARTDLTGRFLEVNDRYCAIVRRTRDELFDLRMGDITHPDDLATNLPLFEAAAAGGPPFEIEKRYLQPDGTNVWVRNSVSAVRDDGEVGAILAVSIDISDRKRVEERLQELNETLEHRVAETLAERRVLADVIDGTDIFVQVIDRDFNWLAINESAAAEFARMFGVRRPNAGDNMLEMLVDRPKDRTAVEAVWSRALAGEEFVEVDEFGDPSLDRRYYEMRFRALRDAAGSAIGAYQFVSDVTERLREQDRLGEAEEALRQSQKMEAMGQLTGGVAHDFNNLLTPIVGSLDMLVRRGVGSDRERRLIDGALQSAERAKILVQRLLAFARRQPLQPTAVDIGRLVDGMSGLIGSTLGPTIDVRIDIVDDLPPAKADPNQLEMALLNLAVNARDAMPDGGDLTFTAKQETVDIQHGSNLKPGDYVRLCVVDTGAGMDKATRERAIEPFFSTKGIGKGTGLGLSMVHGLTAQLGGGLTIESEPGHGTSIELWLPVSTVMAGEKEHVEPAPPTRAGRGTVLLVDDEDLVRMSTADMLMDLGFEVVEAVSAEDALQLITAGLTPDLLVTDHLMPGMNGAELARATRALTPALPVLLVSGYAEVDGIAPELPRLTKPFRNAELAASVGALIPATADDGEVLRADLAKKRRCTTEVAALRSTEDGAAR